MWYNDPCQPAVSWWQAPALENIMKRQEQSSASRESFIPGSHSFIRVDPCPLVINLQKSGILPFFSHPKWGEGRTVTAQPIHNPTVSLPKNGKMYIHGNKLSNYCT